MSGRKQVRLLVVDEQTEFCEALQEVVELSNNNFDITCEFTDCGARAAQLVQEWAPSVVLVDADLTGVDSRELVRSFRHISARVVVTSQVQSRTIEESARQWGASGYVAKSENHAEIEQLVMELATISTTERYLH